jgi:hypothetical protein
MECESKQYNYEEGLYGEACLKTDILNTEPGNSFVLVDARENPIYHSNYMKDHFDLEKSNKSKSLDKPSSSRCSNYPDMDPCTDITDVSSILIIQEVSKIEEKLTKFESAVYTDEVKKYKYFGYTIVTDYRFKFILESTDHKKYLNLKGHNNLSVLFPEGYFIIPIYTISK